MVITCHIAYISHHLGALALIELETLGEIHIGIPPVEFHLKHGVVYCFGSHRGCEFPYKAYILRISERNLSRLGTILRQLGTIKVPTLVDKSTQSDDTLGF